MPVETSYTPGKSSHVVFKDGNDSKPIEAVADVNGSGAVRYIVDTAAVAGINARQVYCLVDTVFAVFTRTNATGSIAGITLPAGTTLWGPVTAITLTSGKVAAYD